MPLAPRFLLASGLTSLLLVGDLLVGPELFWPIFWDDSWAAWPRAAMLVILWILPVVWILRRDGIQRSTLAQFLLSIFLHLLLTLLAFVGISIQLVFVASVYSWLFP